MQVLAFFVGLPCTESGPIQEFRRVQPISFHWNDSNQTTTIGEIQPSCPSLVCNDFKERSQEVHIITTTTSRIIIIIIITVLLLIISGSIVIIVA
jgi:hypothetical protein